MEQPNSIVACVSQSSTVEQACDQATEFLVKQTAASRITTERFLLACQQKFHRSMYEVGFSLGTTESLKFSEELSEEAKQLWKTKPENKSFAGYLFGQMMISGDRIPSFLYYIYTKSCYSKDAHSHYSKKNVISGTVCGYNPDYIRKLAFWVDSGILQNKEYLRDLFEEVITYPTESSTPLLRQLLDAKYDPNITIPIPDDTFLRSSITSKNPLATTLLDYAIEHKVEHHLLGAECKSKIDTLMQIIRILIKAGAKSASEL